MPSPVLGHPYSAGFPGWLIRPKPPGNRLFPPSSMDPLPLFRPDPRLSRHPMDVAISLRLEHDTLMQEDRQRAGLPG
jgi:hypothetical protein